MRVHIHLGQMLMGIKTSGYSCQSLESASHPKLLTVVKAFRLGQFLQTCCKVVWVCLTKASKPPACWVNGVRLNSQFSQRMGLVSPRSRLSSEDAVVQVLLAGWCLVPGWCVALFSVSVVPSGAQLQLLHGVTGKLQIDKTGAFCSHIQGKPPLQSKPHISAAHTAWVFVLYPTIDAANVCSSLGVPPDLLWHCNYGHSDSLGSITGTADTWFLWTGEKEWSCTAVKSMSVNRTHSFSATWLEGFEGK